MNKKMIVAIIIVAVFCGALLFYLGEKQVPASEVPAIKKIDSEKQNVNVFPAPEQTVYAMKLYLDVEERLLYGVSEITTINTSGSDLKEIWLTAYPNAFKSAGETPAPLLAYEKGFDEGWMEIRELLVNGESANFIQDGPSVGITMPSIATQSNVNIEINWVVHVPNVKYRFGYHDQVFMLGNFYPVINLKTDAGWHNAYLSGVGDPFCLTVGDYIVEVNIPENYQIASTGQIVASDYQDDGRSIMVVRAEEVRDFCLLVMYDYDKAQETINGVNINCIFPSEGEEEAEKVLQQTGQILQFYSETFGPYPLGAFTVAYVPMEGFQGMEHAGIIFLQEELLQNKNEANHKIFLLAHEIAHQWWFGMVGNDQIQEPWLDEGLANWSAHLFMREMKEIETHSWQTKSKSMVLNQELSNMQNRTQYYNTAYRAGEAFWVGLEKEIGYENVIKILRAYLSRYRNSVATTSDLLQIIQEYSPGDVDPYLNQWFL
ncbi:MAG: M1 family metallopeptidase [Bacillota bacterium]|nr:M1 family metallopeptidase [Bacillota bacterium]